MKVSVIGTGAMGSIYGSFFAKNNFDVLCYDVWDEHVDAINNKGCLLYTSDAADMWYV